MLTIRRRSEQYPLNWIVAPSNESMSEPTSPAPRPMTSTGHCAANCSASVTLPVTTGTNKPPHQKANPTANPPAALATNPSVVTPPFVPGLHSFPVVMSRGIFRDSTPSSLLHVSPQQQP